MLVILRNMDTQWAVLSRAKVDKSIFKVWAMLKSHAKDIAAQHILKSPKLGLRIGKCLRV